MKFPAGTVVYRKPLKKLMALSGDFLTTTTMAALAKTLVELDALTTLSETIKERIDNYVAKARVALETMAVALEDEAEAGEFKEPTELKELKLLEFADPKIISLFKTLLHHNSLNQCLIDNLSKVEIVEKLLPFVDPSAENNRAIRWASQHGHLEVVERLLADPRVDHSAENNQAIRLASKNGHVAVVERLLADPRVDPSAEDNEAICWATHYGHIAIVELLKARGCVLPAT